MTTPERLSDTAPWRDWFEQAMNSGAPIVDNASPRLYTLGELEGDRCDCGTAIPGDVERCDDCEDAQPCPACRGAGGWQQHDGVIVECPRGCMTDDGRP